MHTRDRENQVWKLNLTTFRARWAVAPGFVAALSVWVHAGEPTGLELSAPIGAAGATVDETPPPPPTTSSAPLARQPVISSPSPPASRSVLALPGITTPATAPALPSGADLELPALDAPRGMNQAPAPGRSLDPITLDPVPFEPASPRESARPNSAGSRSPQRRDPIPARSNLATSSRSGAPAAAPSPPPSAARRPWWLGPARPGMPGGPVTTNSGAGRATNRPDRSDEDDPGPRPTSSGSGKSDPGAEVALQKRLERQARSLVGDKVRSVEVRVSGKQVAIEARGVKLFQKRNVRRSLESMSAINGYRSSVSVLD